MLSQGNYIRFSPANLLDSKQLRLKRIYPGSIVKDTAGLILVPRPKTAAIGGAAVRDGDLLRWCTDVVTNILLN